MAVLRSKTHAAGTWETKLSHVGAGVQTGCRKGNLQVQMESLPACKATGVLLLRKRGPASWGIGRIRVSATFAELNQDTPRREYPGPWQTSGGGSATARVVPGQRRLSLTPLPNPAAPVNKGRPRGRALVALLVGFARELLGQLNKEGAGSGTLRGVLSVSQEPLGGRTTPWKALGSLGLDKVCVHQMSGN